MIGVLLVSFVIFTVLLFLFLHIIGFAAIFAALLVSGMFYLLGYGSVLITVALWLFGMYYFGEQHVLVITAVCVIIFLIIFMSSCSYTYNRIKNHVHAKTSK